MAARGATASSKVTGLRDLAGFVRSYAIYRARPWRNRERIAFYRKLVRAGDLCFDIGAHVGNHTEAWLALGARAVAVEPQPQFAEFLRSKYGGRPDVTVLDQAVGRKSGETTLLISTLAPTVTSASSDWIKQVKRSPGFSKVDWDREETVGMTTLDALIAEHGVPAFCKIDVEGYEAEVLAGLRQALPQLCFEFIPPAMEVALACLNRLNRLGEYRYNLVVGERPSFVLGEWCDVKAMRRRLKDLDPESGSGDVYARLVAPK